MDDLFSKGRVQEGYPLLNMKKVMSGFGNPISVVSNMKLMNSRNKYDNLKPSGHQLEEWEGKMHEKSAIFVTNFCCMGWVETLTSAKS